MIILLQFSLLNIVLSLFLRGRVNEPFIKFEFFRKNGLDSNDLLLRL